MVTHKYYRPFIQKRHQAAWCVPTSSLASTGTPHALLSFLVPSAARLPSVMSQNSPAQPKVAHLNGTVSFSAPQQSGLGQYPVTEGKVMSCHLPPAVSPQPSLGCASCNVNQPATCTHHLGPGLGGEPEAHRPALGAAPLWLVPLTKACLFSAQSKAGRRSQSMLQQCRVSISFRTHRWGDKRCSDLGLIEPS